MKETIFFTNTEIDDQVDDKRGQDIPNYGMEISDELNIDKSNNINNKEGD